MSDPFSIATGVVALLSVAATVVGGLKKFHDGVSVVQETISALIEDVESLARVLESLGNTCKGISAPQGGEDSGHLASLWDDVARAIDRGNLVLSQLESLIRNIDRDCRVMEAPTKQRRLMQAEGRMHAFHVRIQSFCDDLNLKLNIINVCNQRLHQMKTDQTHLTLLEIREEFRAFRKSMDRLKSDNRTRHRGSEIGTTEILKSSAQSAAATLSTAATIVAARQSEYGDDDAMASVFGDGFSGSQNLAIKQWVESVTTSEFKETSPHGQVPEPIADVSVPNDDDPKNVESGDELKHEMIRVLLAAGTQKLLVGDTKGAELKLRDCLERINANEATSNFRLLQTYLDASHQLYGMYYGQQQWIPAQEILLQKLKVRKRSKQQEDSGFLTDILSLAKLMANQDDIAAAQQYAKQALHGFKNLKATNSIRACLHLLIALCERDANENDAQKYSSMLDELSQSHEKPVQLRDCSPIVRQEYRTRNAELSSYQQVPCNNQLVTHMWKAPMAQERSRESTYADRASTGAQNSAPGVPWADVWSRKYKSDDGDEKRKSALPTFVHKLVGVTQKPVISEPTDMVHITHVDFNPVTGAMEGAPSDWRETIGGIGSPVLEQQETGIIRSASARTNRPSMGNAKTHLGTYTRGGEGDFWREFA